MYSFSHLPSADSTLISLILTPGVWEKESCDWGLANQNMIFPWLQEFTFIHLFVYSFIQQTFKEEVAYPAKMKTCEDAALGELISNR